jgi:hypothetical protein
MKKILLELLFITLFFGNSIAQSVTISPGNAANLQLPKLHANQILNLPSARKGMMVFDSTNNCIKYYNGSEWNCLTTGQPAQPETKYNSWSDGGGLNEFMYDIALDSEGNIIMVGQFYSEITFGPTNLQVSGNDDGFIAKFDPDGKLKWLKKLGGYNLGVFSLNYCRKVKIDGNDNIYVLSIVTLFDDLGLGFSNTGISFTKYNSSGVLISQKTIGNPSSSGGVDATDFFIDINNKVNICGSFGNGTTDFGSGTPSTPIGGSDIFILKLNNDASLSYNNLIQMGGAGNDVGMAIEGDQTGNIYLLGKFSGAAFLGGVAQTANYPSTAFLIKISSAGSSLWFTQFGSSSSVTPLCLGKNSLNELYAAGSFSSSLTVPSFQVFNSSGSADSFILKISDSGTALWAKVIGGLGNDDIYDISVEASGVHFAGIYSNKSFLKDKFYYTQSVQKGIVGKLDNDGNFEKIIPLETTNVKSIYFRSSDNSTHFAGEFLGEKVNILGTSHNSADLSQDIFWASYK